MGKKSTAISEAVKVIVRCRPLGKKEIEEGRQSCVNVDMSRGSIEVSRSLKIHKKK